MAAGRDSFAMEPMVAGHPFQGEKNLILSPHIGGVTRDAYVNMGGGQEPARLAGTPTGHDLSPGLQLLP